MFVDLVSEGTESQKNLLQLSRTAQNVWLLTATPFPHGNTSVYANHELLGFCRLRMDVEVNYDLPYNHPFEKIKRKLYIRSPKHVSDDAVTASKLVTRETIYVEVTALERKFFELEKNDVGDHRNKFIDAYIPLRQMMVHPEASKKLREQINGKDDDQREGGEKAKKVAQKNNSVGRYASVNSFARSSLMQAKMRHAQLESHAIPTATKDVASAKCSLYVAMKVRQVRASPVIQNPFANQSELTVESPKELEAKAIRDYYKHNVVYFETLGSAHVARTVIQNDVERIVKYFQTEMKEHKMMPWGEGEREAIEIFITAKEASITRNTNLIESLNKEKKDLKSRIKALEATVSVGRTKVKSEVDDLAARHGSKSARLIRYLQDMEENEQTIVFSYWHDTLSLVHRSLKRCGLKVSFCDGNSHSMAKALSDFTTGVSSVLLLSAHAKASGANLQCATNVVLLDPSGSSAEHGAALEQQAIGRAVRMGQEKSVKVVRFCVKDSIEEVLFERIDDAAIKLDQRSNDKNYTCENSQKSLGLVENETVEEDDPDDCHIGETVSDKERVSRLHATAVANNDIICIDDSDDEADTPHATLKSDTLPSDRCSQALPESSGVVSGKRVNMNIEINTCPEKKPKITEGRGQINDVNVSPLANITNTLCDVSAPRESTSMPNSTIEFSWKDQQWLEKFEELKQHKMQTGLAFVSGGRTDLSRWCYNQRAAFKRSGLSLARVQALNDINFPWTHAENYQKQATPGKVNLKDVTNPLPMVTPSLATNTTWQSNSI